MGVDDLELTLKQAAEVDRVHLGHAGDIGMAEGDGNRRVTQDFVVVFAIVGRGDVGGYDSHTAYLFLQPVGIVLHADGNAVHHGRESIAAKTDIKIINSHDYSCVAKRCSASFSYLVPGRP